MYRQVIMPPLYRPGVLGLLGDSVMKLGQLAESARDWDSLAKVGLTAGSLYFVQMPDHKLLYADVAQDVCRP